MRQDMMFRIGVRVAAVVCLMIGMIWGVAISQRCRVLNRKPLPVPAVEREVRAETPLPVRVQRTVEVAAQTERVKPYQVAVFWALVIWEAVCAAAFVLTGIFLLMGARLSAGVTFFTAAADLIFKTGCLACMRFWAVPLARTLGRANLLTAYYAPREDVWSEISGYLTLLKPFERWGWPVLIVYGVCLAGVAGWIFTASRSINDRNIQPLNQ